MKIKQVTLYECEVCGEDYLDKSLAEECEQNHSDYEKWFNNLPLWGQSMVSEVGRETYEEALHLLKESNNVVSIQETDDLGGVKFSIAPIVEPDFWLDTTDDIETAKHLCKEYGWEYDY